MKISKQLKKEEIVERWSYLLDGAQGRGKEIFRGTKANIKEVNPPHVQFKAEMLTPKLTLVGVLRPEKRRFLVASNEYLKGYRLCVGARDYGKQLMVSWYLIAEPVALLELIWDWITTHQKVSLGVAGVGLILSLAMRTISPIFLVGLPFLGYVAFKCLTSPKSVLPQMMSIFDLEELTAYVTTVHHAVLEATKEVAESVGFDFTKVDTKSRGFLNIS